MGETKVAPVIFSTLVKGVVYSAISICDMLCDAPFSLLFFAEAVIFYAAK